MGEVRDRRALVALLAALVEDVGERAPVLAEDALERGGVGDVEAGGDDDGIDFADGAVLRDHRVGRDLGDAVGHQVDVVLREGGVVVVRDQHALAADLEVRRDLLAQILVLDLAAQVALGRELQRLHEDRGLRESDDLALAHPVDAGAAQLLEAGEVFERGVLELRVLAVRTGQDPRRRALVHVEVRHLLADGGHDLDGRGAGADDGDALPRQVGVVVPAGGVEDLALEAFDAFDVREGRLAQRADRGDEDLRDEVPPSWW